MIKWKDLYSYIRRGEYTTLSQPDNLTEICNYLADFYNNKWRKKDSTIKMVIEDDYILYNDENNINSYEPKDIHECLYYLDYESGDNGISLLLKIQHNDINECFNDIKKELLQIKKYHPDGFQKHLQKFIIEIL